MNSNTAISFNVNNRSFLFLKTALEKYLWNKYPNVDVFVNRSDKNINEYPLLTRILTPAEGEPYFGSFTCLAQSIASCIENNIKDGTFTEDTKVYLLLAIDDSTSKAYYGFVLTVEEPEDIFFDARELE